MSLSKSICWYSNNCLHFLKCAVPLVEIYQLGELKVIGINMYKNCKKLIWPIWIIDYKKIVELNEIFNSVNFHDLNITFI
jgi:hypothetical protein